MSARPVKTGDEQDALTRGHRYLNWKPGERKAVKARYNRKDRRQARTAIRNRQEG